MVHQYKLNGYNIVLDSCSGSIHVVDDVAYDIIAMYQDNSPEEIVKAVSEKYAGRQDVKEKDILDCIEDIKALIAAGKLFTQDTFSEMAGTFKQRSGRYKGAVPACRPYLQPQLRILLRQPGQVSRRARADEL